MSNCYQNYTAKTFKKEPINNPITNTITNSTSIRIAQKKELFYGQAVAATTGTVVVLNVPRVESQQ